MRRALSCPRCGKKAVKIGGVTSGDGRHKYTCGNCKYSYTSGKTSVEDTITREQRIARTQHGND